MTPEQFDNICRAALERYGFTAQALQFCEEAGEAIVAVSHWQRGRNAFEEVLGELADLTIMIRQMQLAAGITDDELNERIAEKIQRLKARLENPNCEE